MSVYLFLAPSHAKVNIDIVHHLYLSEFKKTYPDAKLIGVAETLERMEDKALKFDGGKPPDTPFICYLILDDLHSLGERFSRHQIWF